MVKNLLINFGLGLTKGIEDNQKPPLYVFDSTEKCGGTTLKRYLRSNFQQDNFFDLDNGDPLSEKVRNYGISCPVHFSDYIHLLNHDEINFYEIFSEYLKDRAQWCCTALPKLDIKCLYGNMVHYTTLVDNLKEYYDVKLCKFFREPASRVASEYFYVLNHDRHNLHSVAKEGKTPVGYALHPRRPKNRQVASVIGREGGDANSAIEKIINDYFFLGKVENLTQDLARFGKIALLSTPKLEHLNTTAKPWDWHNSQDKRQFIRAICNEDKEDYALYKALG